jgi:hypothetical protein
LAEVSRFSDKGDLDPCFLTLANNGLGNAATGHHLLPRGGENVRSQAAQNFLGYRADRLLIPLTFYILCFGLSRGREPNPNCAP